jgi:hypothetical protein
MSNGNDVVVIDGGNGDEGSDENDDDLQFAIGSSASDLVNGRSTIFCCLSCGVPFSLPDDSYIYQQNNRNMRQFIWFTHFVRRQMRLHDRSIASTKQWQLEMSHYLHRYLHKNIVSSSRFSATTPASVNGNIWTDQAQFIPAATRLVQSIQVRSMFQHAGKHFILATKLQNP